MLNNTLYSNIYTPDVLSCLANLSNDEVFTPPEIANQMLDLLPQELFASPETKFLDPACKSGVFLREIAKRLLKGLEPVIPDLQQRVEHIFQRQLYGIAITELTSLLSRRSLYCSKYPNGGYSVAGFADAQGNIRFGRTQHRWKDGRCQFCGASQSQYERGALLETHAYAFIHTTRPEEIFDMKFDVIIGNPPYQLSDGGGMGTSATALYDKFVTQAIKMNPRYMTMIIPARWYSGGKGLDAFRDMMLNNQNIRILVDFFNAADCFPGIDLSGGVCYFLWDREHKGECAVTSIRESVRSEMIRPMLEPETNTFVRFNEAIPIIRKIRNVTKPVFSEIVSARKPFGSVVDQEILDEKAEGSIKIYSYPKNGYILKRDIHQNVDWINKYKVFVSKAYGERGNFPYLVLGKPFIGEPMSSCSETYLVVGPCTTFESAKNILSYMRTKFFRFLVLLKKNTQNAPKGVYSFVPIQDFSKPWTDAELYAKYGLTDEEIAFIESMIKPMDLNGGADDAE